MNWSTPLRRRYREMLRSGMTETDAANLLAYEEGLDIVKGGWTLTQIEQLLFLRNRDEHEHPEQEHGPLTA
jgi:hypothetical protein